MNQCSKCGATNVMMYMTCEPSCCDRAGSAKRVDDQLLLVADVLNEVIAEEKAVRVLEWLLGQAK